MFKCKRCGVAVVLAIALFEAGAQAFQDQHALARPTPRELSSLLARRAQAAGSATRSPSTKLARFTIPTAPESSTWAAKSPR